MGLTGEGRKSDEVWGTREEMDKDGRGEWMGIKYNGVHTHTHTKMLNKNHYAIC